MMHYEKLSDAHKIFVDSYVDCLNYTKAYQDMYPDKTYNSARTLGSELAAKPYIRNAIIEKLKERQIDKTETLQRIIQVIQLDLTAYINKDFSFNIEAFKNDGYGWMLKGYKRGKVFELLFLDKDKALEQLVKIHQLYDDSQTVNVNINQEISAKERLESKLKDLDQRLNK